MKTVEKRYKNFDEIISLLPQGVKTCYVDDPDLGKLLYVLRLDSNQRSITIYGNYKNSIIELSQIKYSFPITSKRDDVCCISNRTTDVHFQKMGLGTELFYAACFDAYLNHKTDVFGYPAVFDNMKSFDIEDDIGLYEADKFLINHYIHLGCEIIDKEESDLKMTEFHITPCSEMQDAVNEKVVKEIQDNALEQQKDEEEIES